MSKRYENVIKKYKNKARKRVQRPQNLEDFVNNLGFDLKDIELFLHGINVKNVVDMKPEKLRFKIDRVKMMGFQAIHNLTQISRLMLEKEWIGNDLDFNDIEPSPIIFEPKKEEEDENNNRD